MTESNEKNPFFRVIRRLDDALYAVEGTVVTLFVVLMTLMVSADVLQRRVSDPKSKIGSALARVFGVENPETLRFFEETGGNVLVGLALLGLIVFGFYAAERGRASQGESFEKTRVIVGSGVGVVVTGLVAYLVGNPDIPSRVIFISVFCLGGLGLLVMTARKRPRGWPLLAVVVVLGTLALAAFAFRFIPEGYTWSKKVSLLLLMWVAFLGASMCAHDGKHLRLEAFARLVPERIAPYVEALGALATVLVCTFFAWLVGVEVFQADTGLRAMGEQIEMTEIPAWIRIFSAVVGFGILGLRYLGVAASAAMGGTYGKPKSELEEVLETAAPAEVKS